MSCLCACAHLGGWRPSISSSPQHVHHVLGLVPLIYQHYNYIAWWCGVGCRAWRVLCKCNLSAGKLSFMLCSVHRQSCPHAGPSSATQNSLTAHPFDWCQYCQFLGSVLQAAFFLFSAHLLASQHLFPHLTPFSYLGQKKLLPVPAGIPQSKQLCVLWNKTTQVSFSFCVSRQIMEKEL